MFSFIVSSLTPDDIGQDCRSGPSFGIGCLSSGFFNEDLRERPVKKTQTKGPRLTPQEQKALKGVSNQKQKKQIKKILSTSVE